MTNLYLIIFAFGFVFLNAFFVAAEFAMVKLRHTRVQAIKKLHGFAGKILSTIHQHLDAYLSACQLGITLASLGLGWIGEPAFAHLLQPLFHHFNMPLELSKFIAFIFAFSIISFLHIVVGELMPKSMAIRQSEKVSLWTAIPLYMFYWLMFPAIWLLNHSANALLKLFRLDQAHHGEHTYAPEELRLILKSSNLHGKFAGEHKEMLLRMLEFTDLQAADVMRPLEDMISINIAANLTDILDIIEKYHYSRYPVYQNDNSQFVGILHSKDLLSLFNQNTAAFKIQDILRPTIKIQHDDKAADTFQQFRDGKPHLALVYQEGKLIGFLTLDTLLHAILGKMRDEFHLTQEDYKLVKKGKYIIRGNAPLYVLEKLAGLDSSQYQVNTVGGLLLQELGHLPKTNESATFSNFVLTAHKVKQAKIITVILTLHSSYYS